MSQQKPPKKESPFSSYAQYSGIVIQMIAIIGLGSYGGIKLDEAYPNEHSLYTILGSLISVAMAMYVAIKQVSNLSK